MKILALDSSGLVASVAVAEDDVLTAEYTVNYKKTHSQTLLPMLQAVKDMIELDLSTVDAIAVAAGPGSFTGLRIGSATAKGLALAMDCPIVEVKTVEGLAYNLYGTDKVVCPLMDARRNQVYTGLYEVSDGIRVLKDQCAVDVADIIAAVNELGREVIFLGDGVPVYKEQLENGVKVPYEQTACRFGGGAGRNLFQRRKDRTGGSPPAHLPASKPGGKRTHGAGGSKGWTVGRQSRRIFPVKRRTDCCFVCLRKKMQPG